MTERLYYENSFLHDFVAALVAVRRLPDGRIALVFDRTRFLSDQRRADFRHRLD